jgi:hypothetical protein
VVKGLRRFREHFRDVTDAFVVIGGVACDEWFTSQDLTFRATKDIDIVLIIEPLSEAFVEKFWEFVDAGGYEIRERSDGSRIYYRFAKPSDADFPVMLEIFSRKPEGIDLAEGQRIVPISTETDAASLSAILMNDAYYELLLDHRLEIEGLPVIQPAALIPLKARAWLDLAKLRESGESVDSKDIYKHRNDVFRLTATLPGQPGPQLDIAIRHDLRRFLDSFPRDSADWQAIRASLKGLPGGAAPSTEALLDTLMIYFRLREKDA